MRSFRVRLMLWNVVLSGAVLAVFGSSAWLLSCRVSLDRLDGDIRDNARRELNEVRRPAYRQRADHKWHSEYGGGPERVRIAILVRERDGGRVIFQSPGWPDKLASDRFANPAEPPESQQQPPDFENPPPQEPRVPPFGNPGQGPEGNPGPPPRAAVGDFATIKIGGGAWRFGVMGDPNLTVILGVPLQPFYDDLMRLARILFAAFLPGILLIAASGWILASRALRPVAALTGTAERITARGLSQRLPATREAQEFNRLTGVFNDMLDRLEKSFLQATRFSADAAHELKTPLTILQGRLEESLRSAPDGSAQQHLSADLLEEVQRLKNITRKLLLLSMADAGELKLNREPVDLKEVVESAAEDAKILAPNLRIETNIANAVKFSADPDLIRQIVQNLASNAIKYNRDGGFILLELGSTEKGVRLAVTNSGTPIATDQKKVFERFFCADPSRAKTVEGVGLGLSLAREIARAHGGDLVLERSDETGTTFALKMPVA